MTHLPEPGPTGTSESPVGAVLCDVLRVKGDSATSHADQVIEEVPVALVFNGISHAVMLASPTDLEDFAVGFSLSEGIVEHAHEIHDMDIRGECAGMVVEMTIASERFFALKDRRRSMVGRTGCGLCGIESLEAIAAHNAISTRTQPGSFKLSSQAIDESLRQLPHWQPLRSITGASHGAAWCDTQGNIVLLREDVGRHNALDKLVGALARQRTPVSDGFVLVTSRASYEMVQKTARAGISALVAVSAPTTLAVQMANSAGLMLIGFARDGQHVIYSQPQRLALQPSSTYQTLA
jgi:formate dehydrogenase accessory protein FdhD